jgi:hypothetical protein
VHLLIDTLGDPVRFDITGGKWNDGTQAPALLPPGPGSQVFRNPGHDG